MKKYIALLLLTTSMSVAALDIGQINALNTYATTDTESQACIAAGDDGCLYNRLNAASTFTVWRTRVEEQNIYQDSGFNFSLVDGLTAGKRDEWNLLFKTNSANPSRANIRAGFLDIWSGTAAKSAVNAVILELSKRFATNAESVLATGTGSNASPGLLTFEGTISFQDVARIRLNN
jgi:hypothetical protein